jgi:hypothetical protein
MKTGNKVKRAAALLAVLGLTLIMMSHPAEAQDSGKSSNGGEGKSRRQVQDNTFSSQSAKSYAAEIEARKYSYARFEMVDITEAPMQLESWMVDRRYFIIRRSAETAEVKASESGKTEGLVITDAVSLLLVPIADEPLKLETWMTDTANFPCERKNKELYTEVSRLAGK